jgi:hypothetical protein
MLFPRGSRWFTGGLRICRVCGTVGRDGTLLGFVINLDGTVQEQRVGIVESLFGVGTVVMLLELNVSHEFFKFRVRIHSVFEPGHF